MKLVNYYDYGLSENKRNKKQLRIAYICRSFLDYRVPVFEALNRISCGGLYVVFNKEVTPERVQRKIFNIIGNQAIGLEGEMRIGPKVFSGFANSAFRVTYQPGAIISLRRIRPEIIVGDGFFQWTAFAIAYKILYGVPLVICYERTGHTERRAQWLRRSYRKLVLNLVDSMSCNGRLSLYYAKSLGMDEKRITTGHMVADTENIKKKVAELKDTQLRKLREFWGNPNLVFLSVGRLIPSKGFRQLLEGWSRFYGAFDGTSALVIVGSGPEHDRLLDLTERLKLKSVYLAGEVDYDDITVYYASADIFVMPTLEDNWSLVVPEAMACSLPILCSKFNGCWPEMIQDGVNGWVFDPMDITSIVDVFEKIVKNKTKIEEMGRASRKIVNAYTHTTAATAILRACEIALNPKK